MRRLISSGSKFEALMGYSRAVVDGDWVFVSGTTGFNYATMQISDDIAEQTEQALRNIEEALKKADCTLADVVRVHYLLPDIGEFEKCFAVLGKYFGEIRPAATAFGAALTDAKMKIEIEVTARKGSAASAG